MFLEMVRFHFVFWSFKMIMVTLLINRNMAVVVSMAYGQWLSVYLSLCVVCCTSKELKIGCFILQIGCLLFIGWDFSPFVDIFYTSYQLKLYMLRNIFYCRCNWGGELLLCLTCYQSYDLLSATSFKARCLWLSSLLTTVEGGCF
jgi:hypothetical protein